MSAAYPPSMPSPTLSGRRDTQSSSTSSTTRSSSSRTNGHPAVESAVTRLLVSIKQLLESLTKWSTMKIDENDVSDVYVRLGNDFNAAVAAFTAFGIDMAELLSVPEELRMVLEQCLAEDATPDNLAIYLPTVRQIITNLLQGLRGKQSVYRRIVSDHRHRSDRSESSVSERPGGSRSSRQPGSRSSRPPGAREKEGRRSIGHRRSDTGSSSVNGRGAEEPFVGGFAPSVSSMGSTPVMEQDSLDNPPMPTVSRASPSLEAEPPSEQPGSSSEAPQWAAAPPTDGAATLSPPMVPANIKRWSLVDTPLQPPDLVVEPASPDPDTLTNGTSSPSTFTDPSQDPSNSLAALKKSDTLERRASKRFSTYNISKMTGSGPRDRGTTRSNSTKRRSLVAAGSSALTKGELAVLSEEGDEELPVPAPSRETSRVRTRPSTPEVVPPIPPLPATPSRTPEPVHYEGAAPALAPSSSKIAVFLQLGREVKRSAVEPGSSIAALRMLFVDKFSYNPGLENFPAIYIRDPSSGVQYELEDMDEVKEKCLLSLNIDGKSLDQIKQHLDTHISSLAQDIKELRTVVTQNRSSAHLLPTIQTSPLVESAPSPRPTDRQFRQVAQRLSRFVGDSGDNTFVASRIQAQTTGHSLQPQTTGGSMLSDYSSRVVTDLKTQFDEVQNLRRDLGIMRQLYTEFMKQTKESLNTFRTQTQSVKQLANTNVGGARAFIDSGKNKLDIRSQNVLTEVEKLQDTVEGLKDDVLKRHITPKVGYMKTITKDMDRVAAELQSLKEHIETIKPMWKTTWAEELQNIVEEQQFLTHQEEFLSDLLEDHKAVVEVHGRVEQVIGIRGSGAGSGKLVGRRPGLRQQLPPPQEDSNGLNSMMLEIRSNAVDPEKRLKAIEANQRNREKELASRSDDLHLELSDFVGQKKLKMTGGAEETERVRQKRNDMALKAMFTGGSIGGGDGALNSPDLNTP